MIRQGLSHYQSVQKSAGEIENNHVLEKIMKKAALYDIAFLQNRALMETILNFPEMSVDAKMIKKMEELLLWLSKTQEGATLS